MKITIIATGKQRGYIGEDVVLEYINRLAHYMPVSWVYVSGSSVADESRAMMKHISSQAYVVILDEHGKDMSSQGLADLLTKRLNESVKEIHFIIGGAYGIGDEVRERANYIWSLSKLTFPHELVRGILAEALYRACTINKGEGYHHA